MPNKCVLGCNGAKHAFHFPKDSALFDKWSTFVTDINKDWHYSNHSVLCERHFEPKYFVVGKKRTKLLYSLSPVPKAIKNDELKQFNESDKKKLVI